MKYKGIILVALCAISSTHAKVDERVICALGEKLAPELPKRLQIKPTGVGSVLYLVAAAEKSLKLGFNRTLYGTLQEFYRALQAYGTEELKRSLPESVSALEREHVSNVILGLFRYKSADVYSDGTQKTPFRPALSKALLIFCEIETHPNTTSADALRAFLEIKTGLQQVFTSEAKRLEQQKIIPVDDIRQLVTMFDVYLQQFQESWLSPAFLLRTARTGGLVLGMLSALRLLYVLNNKTDTRHVAVWEAKRAFANINNLFARTGKLDEKPAVELRGGIFGFRDQLLSLKGKVDSVLDPLKHWVSDGQPGELKPEDEGKIKRMLENAERTFMRLQGDTLPQAGATLATVRERAQRGFSAKIDPVAPLPHEEFLQKLLGQFRDGAPPPQPTPPRRQSVAPVDTGAPPSVNGGGLLSYIPGIGNGSKKEQK